MNREINVKPAPAFQRALLCLLLLLTISPKSKAQTLSFTTNADGLSLSVTRYSPPPFIFPGYHAYIVVPTNFNGLPVTEITSNAFATSGAVYIGIPATITNIETGAFTSCSGLEQIIVDSNNPSYSSFNGALLDKQQTTLIQYPRGQYGIFDIPSTVTMIEPGAFYDSGVTSVTIPGSVGTIGENCFAECRYLTNAVILDGITNISLQAFMQTGLSSIDIPASVSAISDNAFALCNELESINVDSNNLAYSSVSGVLLDKYQSTLIQCPQSFIGQFTVPNTVTEIPDRFFELCQKLTGIAIPNSVTNIGTAAFGMCRDLTDVTIPGSVKSIDDTAFGGCQFLTNVILLEGINTIGKTAFFGIAMTNISIPVSVTLIGTNAFGACFNLASISVEADNPSYSSANGILFDKNQTALLCYPAGLSSVETLPGSVTSIGDYAYAYCRTLTSLTFPGGITNIGQYGLAYCSALSNVTISASVRNIESNAFAADAQLAGIFFRGNAPAIDPTAYTGAAGTYYYLPGATGWSSPFDGHPAVLWNPTPQTADGSFGIQSNQFGFNITGSPQIPFIVERSTSLESQNWIPVATNNLASGQFFFSDQSPPTNASAFYRITTP
ncbi:MAG TPA: leucine-rich repeat domain-containing protein [Verrucomicrobiae bacterium]|jgi:hypothetical protein